MERVGGFTLIDEQEPRQVEATVEGGSVRLTRETVRDALGWTLEPRGLCRGDACVPVREGDAVMRAGRIDLESLAHLLDRPLALDVSEGVAALGAAARERADRLESLQAPDFRLPDVEGRMHSLSDHRGKKVLLVAYASW